MNLCIGISKASQDTNISAKILEAAVDDFIYLIFHEFNNSIELPILPAGFQLGNIKPVIENGIYQWLLRGVSNYKCLPPFTVSFRKVNVVSEKNSAFNNAWMVLCTRIIKGYKFQRQREDLNFKLFACDNNYLTQQLPIVASGICDL